MPGLLSTIWRGLKWTGRKIAWAWTPTPQPQMQQFVGTAIVASGIGGFVLKSMVVALPLAGAAGYIGNWVGEWRGDYKGYTRALRDVKIENDKLNDQISKLNEELDEKHRAGESADAAKTASIAKSLTEIPAEQRKQCSIACGLPKSLKAQIQEIQ